MISNLFLRILLKLRQWCILQNTCVCILIFSTKLVALVGGHDRRISLRWGYEGEYTLIGILFCFTLWCSLSCHDSTERPSADCNVMVLVCPASRPMCSISLYSFCCLFVVVIFWDRASYGKLLCRLPSVKCPVSATECRVRWTKCHKPVGWAWDQDCRSTIPTGTLLTCFFWDWTSTISSSLNKEGVASHFHLRYVSYSYHPSHIVISRASVWLLWEMFQERKLQTSRVK